MGMLCNRLALCAAVSLCISPTAAMAATSTGAPTLTGSYSPIVTLSVLGSGISAAALCGAAAASAAQAPTGGCVLPALDAPPPVAVAAPPPPPPAYVPVAVATSSGFLVPLIGGLAALVGILALISFGKDNPNGGGLTPPPITPQ